VGKRDRRRARAAEPEAPTVDYADADGNVLTLRGSMSAATRRAYADAASGSPLSAEDAWQRATEFLFERLAVRWVIAGLPIERQAELLGRFRLASADERDWVRATLREHCAALFPDVAAP
jgi:hypothetical protein